jgi:soluble lytic murein transglycosylase-like protein
MKPTPASTAGSAIKPDSYRPDLYRRFAELLVDGGLLTRREVEVALRQARRARQPLAQWLIRNGHIKSQHLLLVRRLETLLVHHGGGIRIAELLVDSGEITRSELRRALEIREQTGQPLGDVLARQGWLGRAPRPPRRSLTPPLAAAATLAAVSVGAWGFIQTPSVQLASTVTISTGVRPDIAALLPQPPLVDLRFASLGDIAPHLKRLRQRPGPYRQPATLTGSFRQRSKKLRPLVNQYARKYELPPALILAVIEQESSFNPLAYSKKQGVGLMQLVPNEGGREAYRYSERKAGVPTLQELQDPKTNIRLGSAYLRLLLDRHFDDIENEDARVAVALAAYNWGPTRMRKALRTHGLPETVDDVEALLKKHAPAETQDYVRDITYRMEAYG